MSKRDYNLIVGPETSTAPTAGTPTNDEDTLSKGWLEEHGFSRSAIHEFVANVAAMKAIDATTRQDGMLCVLDSANNVWKFDSSSSATGDDIEVIQPTSGTGRWLVVSGGGGGGGSVGNIYKNALVTESVIVSDNPIAVCPSRRNCLEITNRI